MHMYVLARGAPDSLARWKNTIMSFALPYKTGINQNGVIQLMPRHVELLEIAFPEDQLNEVLQIVQPMDFASDKKYKGLYNGIAGFFRKILKLEPIPKYVSDGKFRMFPYPVGIHGIGLKKDVFAQIEQI